MTTLTRQRIIMHRGTRYNDYIRFVEALDEPDPPDWTDMSGRSATTTVTPRSVVMRAADWIDMDRPDTLTVTIEPGDHLNP